MPKTPKPQRHKHIETENSKPLNSKTKNTTSRTPAGLNWPTPYNPQHTDPEKRKPSNNYVNPKPLERLIELLWLSVSREIPGLRRTGRHVFDDGQRHPVLEGKTQP